jgi:hypothetical protein
MKNLFLLLVVVIMLSCKQSNPMIGDTTHPFIITEIKNMDNGWCEYTGSRLSTRNYDIFNSNPILYLPVKMFNVGDTVKLNNLKSWPQH